jgi:hypothetical protein
MAWERHGMCESALTVTLKILLIHECICMEWVERFLILYEWFLSLNCVQRKENSLSFYLDAVDDSGNSSKCCGLMVIAPRQRSSNTLTFMKPT